MFEFYKFFSFFYKSPKYLVVDCKKIDEKEYIFKVVSILNKDEGVNSLGLSAQPLPKIRKKTRKYLEESLTVSREDGIGEFQFRKQDWRSDDVVFGSMYSWRILLIDESDIGFYNIFSKLVVNDSRYFLVGSCGSGNASDCFAKVFYVNSAFKGDRGVLNEKGEFSFNKMKLVTNEAKVWDDHFLLGNLKNYNIESRMCCSTNFLNVNIIEDDFAECLFDMETYEFYDICKAKGIKNYACFRFVTDYVVPRGITCKDKVEELIEERRKSFLPEETYNHFNESTSTFSKSQKKKLFRLRLQIDFDFLVSLSEGMTPIPKKNVSEDRVNFYFNVFRNIWDEKYHETLAVKKKVDQSNSLLCYRCGEEGHKMRNCPHIPHPSQGKACHNCQEYGHRAKDCNGKCYICGQYGHTQKCPTITPSSRQKQTKLRNQPSSDALINVDEDKDDGRKETMTSSSSSQIEQNGSPYPEDIIQLVIDQTGCSRENALNALYQTHGDLVSAILKITQE